MKGTRVALTFSILLPVERVYYHPSMMFPWSSEAYDIRFMTSWTFVPSMKPTLPHKFLRVCLRKPEISPTSTNTVSLLLGHPTVSGTVSQIDIFLSESSTQMRSVAGQTILPSILNGFARITNASDPLMILHQEISYKPFISLFKMTAVAEHNPELAGIGKVRSLYYWAYVVMPFWQWTMLPLSLWKYVLQAMARSSASTLRMERTPMISKCTTYSTLPATYPSRRS